MSNKSEVMLAVWPDSNVSPYASRDPLDSQSMWLYFRCVETEKKEDGSEKLYFDTSNEGAKCSDAALYVWAWTNMSVNISLKAHGMYSANVRHLLALAAWMKKRVAKIEKAQVPESFGLREQIILTLQAMGIKKAVMIGPGFNELSIITVEAALALPNYSKVINDMQALRERGRKPEAA